MKKRLIRFAVWLLRPVILAVIQEREHEVLQQERAASEIITGAMGDWFESHFKAERNNRRAL